MDKINFRFSLIQARFPGLYQEAESKIAGGVDRKDILADWLNELVCRRMSGVNQVNKPDIAAMPEADNLDFNAAASIMDALMD